MRGCCVTQVREHAVSFFSSLCDIILAGAASPLYDIDPRTLCDPDSRSGSLKRKHVGSTPSLSEAEHGATADAANGSRPTPTPHRGICEEDSSSSSLSACSSDLAICDDLPPEEPRSRNTRSESPRDSFRTSERHYLPTGSAAGGDVAFESHPDYLAMSESEFNRNVPLPGSVGWAVCPNVSLAGEDAVRSLARVASTGSGCAVDFEDSNSDDAAVQSSSSPLRRLCANVLVVSHGGFISQLLGHFADGYDCCLPCGGKIATTVTPNAGLSRFLVTVAPSDVENENDPEYGRNLVSIRCVALHDKDHLANDVDVEPLPTSEPV